MNASSATLPFVRWLDAAEQLLRGAGTAMHYRELGDLIVSRDLVQTNSKTPSITLHASIALDIKRRDRGALPARFVLRRGGDISLADWEGGQVEEVQAAVERSREHARRDLIRKLRQLEGADFESFLEVLFSEMGYDVTVTGGTGDDGIDLVAELSVGIGAQRVGIQAKAVSSHQRRIGPNPIRLLRDALSTKACNAGALASTVQFNADAHAVASEAGKPPVQLLGPDELGQLALEYRVGIVSTSLEHFRENLPGAFTPDVFSTSLSAADPESLIHGLDEHAKRTREDFVTRGWISGSGEDTSTSRPRGKGSRAR